MEYHFGYNCTHFIPSFGKCCVRVNEYRKRPELVDEKEFLTNEIMVYLGLSQRDLLVKIRTGEIKVKRKKKVDGRLVLTASVASRFDECSLAKNGGWCLNYIGHNGKKISCLMEMVGIEKEHPNIMLEPSEDHVLMVEQDIKKISKAS